MQFKSDNLLKRLSNVGVVVLNLLKKMIKNDFSTMHLLTIFSQKKHLLIRYN